jgi:hypothetical protein
MSLTKIACPKCHAALKSGVAIAAGAKIKCPKCGSMFLHEPVEEIAEYDEVAERDDDIDTAEPEEERPRKKLKKKKKTRDNRLLITAVSIGAVVLLIAGGTYAAFQFFRSPSFDEPLAFVPADSNFLLTVDNDTVYALGLQQMMSKQFTAAGIALSECKEKTGLDSTELFHQQTQTSFVAAPNAKGLVVYRSKVPFKQSKVVDFLKLKDEKTLNGKKYYATTIQNIPMTIYFPSNRLIVWMRNYSESDMKPILEADGTKIALPATSLERVEVARAGATWLFVPVDAAQRQTLALFAGMGGLSAQESTAYRGLLEKVNSVIAWVKSDGSQMQFNAQVQCADPATASQLSAELQREWDAKIKAVASILVQNASFTAQGNQAQVTVALNVAEVQRWLDPLNFGMPPGVPGVPPGSRRGGP